MTNPTGHPATRLICAAHTPTATADEIAAYHADRADWTDYINGHIDHGQHIAYPSFEHWRTGGPGVPAPSSEDHMTDTAPDNPDMWDVIDAALTGAPPPWDVVDAEEKLIQHRVADILREREARRRADETEHPAPQLPPVKPLTELLAEPDDPIAYRIDRVLLDQARTLLAAQFKAGKTTMVANLIRSLADGTDFLGEFKVNRRAHRIAVVDDELSPNMLRRWLREQNIATTDAVADVVALRGNVASFNLLDDRIRDMWARRFADQGVDYLMLDCLRPIFDAAGLDENHDAGKFLVAFDTMIADAGIHDAGIVHHMGHNGERARGDSRLLDWPDAIWRLVRETDDPSSARYFTAHGRDVDVPEGRLDYEPATRRLTYTAVSRADRRGVDKEAKVRQAETLLLAILADHAQAAAGSDTATGLSKNQLNNRITQVPRDAVRTALKELVADGTVTAYDGPKRAQLHKIANPCNRCQLPVREPGLTAHRTCSPPPELLK